jgi:hypothetical protein
LGSGRAALFKIAIDRIRFDVFTETGRRGTLGHHKNNHPQGDDFIRK